MGHDDRTRILEIEYKNGTVYRYKEVPRTVWDELKRIDSSVMKFVAISVIRVS